MFVWNQESSETKRRGGHVGGPSRRAQLVVAVSIAATMVVGNGYVAPSQLGGGFAAAQGGIIDDHGFCQRIEEVTYCTEPEAINMSQRPPEPDEFADYTPSNPLPGSSPSDNRSGGNGQSSSTPRVGQGRTSHVTTRNGQECTTRVIHDPGFPTTRVESCRPIEKEEPKKKEPKKEESGVDDVIQTIAETSCAVGIFKTTYECALAIGKKDPEKIVPCGADIALTGLACGAAIYIAIHGEDERPDALDTSPRTLRMNATAGEQLASVAATSNAAPTVAAPARNEKAGGKGGKRGKSAKGSKGKKRSMAQVRVSGQDSDNNRNHDRANGNKGGGQEHQTRANGHGKGKGPQARGNGHQGHGKGTARGNGHNDHGRGQKNHGKGGKRR
jgi:hypothetical protein